MKLRDHYDWMVLGDHPGALLSGALAARLGLSVLVLPIFPGKSVTVSEAGQLVDHEPNTMLGLGRSPRFSGLLAECLSRLGILPAELEKIQADHPIPQILTPEARLTFGASDEGLTRELEREYGKARADALGLVPALQSAESDLLSYWLQLPERLTLAPGKSRARTAIVSLKEVRKKVARESTGGLGARAESGRWLVSRDRASKLAQEAQRPDLVQALSGLWFGVTSNISVDPELTALLDLVTLARTGASFRGGMKAYRELLLHLAKRLGADIVPDPECKCVFIDKGRFTGVQLAHRGTVIGGNSAVVGCSLAQLESLMSQGGRNWMRRLKKPKRPEGWLFTLGFSVSKAAIAPGVSSRMIWQEPEAPVLEIEVVDPLDYGVRKAEHRLILARTVLPFQPETLTPEYQRVVSARMLRQVSELIPYVESHLLGVYPEFRATGNVAPKTGGRDLEKVYGFSRLDEIPENLRVVSQEAGHGLGSRSGIEGLFIASGESFPEFGSFGGTVAALESVSWLAHRAGMAGPFA